MAVARGRFGPSAGSIVADARARGGVVNYTLVGSFRVYALFMYCESREVRGTVLMVSSAFVIRAYVARASRVAAPKAGHASFESVLVDVERSTIFARSRFAEAP